MTLTKVQARILDIAASKEDGHLMGCPDPRTIRVLLDTGMIFHGEFGNLFITTLGRNTLTNAKIRGQFSVFELKR